MIGGLAIRGIGIHVPMDNRLPNRQLAIGNWQSAIGNRQLAIDNRQSTIAIANVQSQSSIPNRQSVNLQSSICSLQCHG
jgi:hypothetical protein